MLVKQILNINGPLPVRDPFIMVSHQYNKYPKGNGQMGPAADLAGRNIGNDFDRNQGWRMYHGTSIPGFPHHPHRGFEIVTIVEEGYADHFDSNGATGRYGDGDVQLMITGKGVLHAEMFPLIHEDKDNPMRLFQIWLNLPGSRKLVDPDYKMIWHEQLPTATLSDKSGNEYTIKVIVGEYAGVNAVQALEDSWSADPSHHVNIATVTLQPHVEFVMPKTSPSLNRFVYVYDGSGLISIEDSSIGNNQLIDLVGNEEIVLKNGSEVMKIIILEGEPINEPVAAYGPFVMNTEQELITSFNEYKATQFGGWPWGDDEKDLVHPKDVGRFASYDFGKVIDKPNSDT